MKKSRLFVTAYVGLVSILCTMPGLTQAIPLADGGTYIIDYAVTDGLDIANGTTVTLEKGANISGESTSFPGSTIYSELAAALIINDGLVQGDISVLYNYSADSSGLVITGGTINGNLGVFGSDATISGGTIDSIFSESAAHLDISGGTIGAIDTISGSYEITGGIFTDRLSIGADRSASMDIKGGNFTGGFSYSGGTSGDPPQTDNFIFYGDLSLSIPTLISSTTLYDTYETVISGTLMDGSAISQSITCGEVLGVDPCGGVAIVSSIPVPPVLWLFGSGLLGLVGISRRKKTA